MPVRLDHVPALAPRPARPGLLLWLILLPLFLLSGAGLTFLFGTPALREQPLSFWGLALGAPFFGWAMLSFGRVLIYMGQHRAADGWDGAREDDVIGKVRQGRRAQQVLGVSLYTAAQQPGEQPVALDALLGETLSLKAQPTRLGEEPSLHSRLRSGVAEEPETVLLQVLTLVLADLAKILARVPDETPLTLLLEVGSGLPENLLRRVWQQAWRESGIRQSSVNVEDSGLAALDHRLDQCIGDQALLLVVAVQFAPQQPEGMAEAAVGLLFGNRLTQTTLPPMAYLHRPEQERMPTSDDLLYATRQALDWVPLESTSIEQVWRVGVDAQRAVAIASVLSEVPMSITQRRLCNVDAMLGHPGCASPWLAIAAGAQSIQRGAGPQFIFSGDGDFSAGLWGMVLMPVSPLSK